MYDFEKICQNPHELLNELKTLKEREYNFRGVKLSKHLLIPKGFRPEEIELNIANFPIQFPIARTGWFYHKDVLACIQHCYPIMEKDIKKNPIIYRFLFLHFYLMVCNYLFTKYKENNPHRVLEKERIHLSLRNSEWYADIKNFIWLIENTFHLFPTLQGSDWLRKGIVSNIVTAIDMGFPQHYGVSTTVLDWTTDFYIAIYFAIENYLDIAFDQINSLYIAKSDPYYNELLSIYAFKQIHDVDDSPVLLKEIDKTIENPRAINQRGLLSYFSSPCSFYINYGRFPSIEDYLKDGKSDFFDVKKLSLRRTSSNLDSLKIFLDKEEINKKFVYPD